MFVYFDEDEEVKEPKFSNDEVSTFMKKAATMLVGMAFIVLFLLFIL